MIASDELAERIGGAAHRASKSTRCRSSPARERGAILVGPAGTGKGVVIDAAARAEQHTGHRTLGIAVSGSTAQRLGYDSPALAGQTLTLDALVSRVERGQLDVDKATTIYFDEAGMADTARLDRLTEVVERTGSKLVVIGDARAAPLDRRRRHVRPPRPTLRRARSYRTFAARSTLTNSAHGQTSAPVAPTGRWRTTTPADNSTSATPATRQSSRPLERGRS